MRCRCCSMDRVGSETAMRNPTLVTTTVQTKGKMHLAKTAKSGDGYTCPVCGKGDTLVLTGETSVGWDGTDLRSFLKCFNKICNWEGTLPTTYSILK